MENEMSGDEEYARWQTALAGGKLDLRERGDPPSGFFRCKPWRGDAEGTQRTIALWRAGDDFMVEKDFKAARTMTAMEADDLFSSPDIVAITYELYEAVRGGQPWPEVHTTYVRTKDLSTVHWTVEWSQAQLDAKARLAPTKVDPQPEAVREPAGIERRRSEAAEASDNPRAVIGGNNPPETVTPETPAKPLTLSEAVAAKLKVEGELLAGLLKTWGGKPTNKAQADQVADAASVFMAISKEANANRETAKAPHIAAGEAVDAEWVPIRDGAKKYREKALDIANTFINEANAKALSDAEAAHKERKMEAIKQAVENKTPVPEVAPVAAPEPIKLGTVRTVSQRGKKTYLVTDRPKFVAYLMALEKQPDDFVEVLGKIASRLGAMGLAIPGVELEEGKKAA